VGTRFRRRFKAFARAGVALFALFLVVALFEHHDIACHLKTPQHCTACTSSIVGSDPGAAIAARICCLMDAGRAVADQLLADGVLLAVRTTGRSPPIAA
jgi:hypothetical protein